MGSQFWKSLHKVKHMFKWGGGGVVHTVGDGGLTQLWNDVWLEPSPLRICYPKLFEVCDNKDGSVAEYAATGNYSLY
jgi:hypothetical protein